MHNREHKQKTLFAVFIQLEISMIILIFRNTSVLVNFKGFCYSVRITIEIRLFIALECVLNPLQNVCSLGPLKHSIQQITKACFCVNYEQISFSHAVLSFQLLTFFGVCYRFMPSLLRSRNILGRPMICHYAVMFLQY